MKRFLTMAVCLVFVFGVMCLPAFAALDQDLLSQPHDLSVTQMVADDDNPNGGVVLHFNIDNVPLEYEDNEGLYYYYVDCEEKIGENGAWKNIGGPMADELVEGFGYWEAPGKYMYSNTWSEDYKGILVSYRVRMKIDDVDAFSKPIAVTPWSNVASVGIKASSWAAPEIEKAMGYGLVTDSISGDFTKPITREEFAELAVRLYEVYTSLKAEPAPANTFSDCTNPEVLKAFNLRVVNGVGNGQFKPKALTKRQEIAAMLNRAIKVFAPTADFSTAGAPSFTDEKSVASYFVENVKFMSKKGIITGSNGKFDPLGTCTREQAVLMAVRSYEKYK